MKKTVSYVTALGEPNTITLRRGNPSMPVELVIAKDTETLVFTIPYVTLLRLIADGAGFLASKPEMFK